jgi:uncharacterized protein
MHLHLWPRMGAFLLVPCSVLLILHYYIWARLVRDTGLAKPWKTRATAVLFLLWAMVPVTMFLNRSAPRAVGALMVWVFFGWLGFILFLTILLAVGDIWRVFFVTLPRLIARKPFDPERRRFLAVGIGSLAAFSALGLWVVGAWETSAAAIRLKRVPLSLKKLPKSLGTYRIVQVTDLHVGPTIGRDYVQEVVTRVNALKPDLIAVTGDLVDGTVSQLKDMVEPLKDLRAPDGVFFVTGNHEYFTGDVDEWLATLTGLGMRVLRNEHVPIRGSFDLAGVDDLSARGPGHAYQPDRALAGRNPERAVVLLSHQPRGFPDAVRLGVDLQISGHTHGGQFYPFKYIVAFYQPYLAGLYKEGPSTLYVSCGTGYWGPPLRLGIPAEITEYELSQG